MPLHYFSSIKMRQLLSYFIRINTAGQLWDEIKWSNKNYHLFIDNYVYGIWKMLHKQFQRKKKPSYAINLWPDEEKSEQREYFFKYVDATQHLFLIIIKPSDMIRYGTFLDVTFFSMLELNDKIYYVLLIAVICIWCLLQNLSIKFGKWKKLQVKSCINHMYCYMN